MADNCKNCNGSSSQYADNVLRKLYPDVKSIGEISNCGNDSSSIYVHLENNSLVLQNTTIPLDFINSKINSYSYNTLSISNNSLIQQIELLPTTDYVILISNNTKLLQYRFDSTFITKELDCQELIDSEDNFLTKDEIETIEQQSYNNCCNDTSNNISAFDIATTKYLTQYYMYYKWNILKLFTATFIPPGLFDSIKFKVVDDSVHSLTVVQLDIANEE